MTLPGMDVASEILNKNQHKKKKKYLLFLYNKKSSDSNIKMVERSVQVSQKEHTIIRLEDPDEVLRLILIKAIDLIIIDPEFIGNSALTIEYALEIKKRKKIPILFLTSKEEEIIKEYRENMTLYEETDDYCVIPIDFVDIGKRVSKILQNTGRAAKRFQLTFPVEVQRVEDGKKFKAILNDMSVVGVGLVAKSETFHHGAQLQLRLPLQQFHIFHPQYGDFLKLAIKVQRISIDGNTLGCSFEFLTSMQEETIQRALEFIAKRQRQLQASAKRPVASQQALAAHKN